MRNINPLPPICALTGDRTLNLLVHRMMPQPTKPQARACCGVSFQDAMSSGSFIYYLSKIFNEVTAAILCHYVIPPHPPSPNSVSFKYHSIIMFFQYSNSKNKHLSDNLVHLLDSHLRIKENQAIITSNDGSEYYFIATFITLTWFTSQSYSKSKHSYLYIGWSVTQQS